MSEYWKSTPKYWCKHCKTFVKDTKLEKNNHEATPKHQGNLQRFLRQLHQGHEREDREKQRARDEVDRLNGISSASKTAKIGMKSSAIPQSSPTNRQATPAERTKQLQQLAEMGIAVPDDFRKEMAMAGDWHTTAERVMYDTSRKGVEIKKEDDGKESKEPMLNVGVQKRKYEGQEDEEQAVEKVVRRGWGSTTRPYPGAAGEEHDLDALLQNAIQIKRTDGAFASVTSAETNAAPAPADGPYIKPEHALISSAIPYIKREDSAAMSGIADLMPTNIVGEAPGVMHEVDSAETGIVFKKRKSKAMRKT
ncbi:MAG: hypothetical protein Q9163_004357 [Psora crenata]